VANPICFLYSTFPPNPDGIWRESGVGVLRKNKGAAFVVCRLSLNDPPIALVGFARKSESDF
jgi:hypothetical protein